MPTALQDLLDPPRLSADDERTRVARLLHTIALATAVAAAVCGALALLLVREPKVALPFVALLLFSVGALWWERRGHAREASLVFVTLLFVLITGCVVMFGGVGGPIYSAYVLSILAGGLLLGGRGAVVIAALAVGTGWGLVNASAAGLLPAAVGHEHEAIWAGMNPWFFATALFLLLADRSLSGALARLRDAEGRLRASEERYALATRGANDGLWDWDLDADRAYFSPRWKEMLGIPASREESSPSAWLARIHPEDRARVEAEIEAHLSGQSAQLGSEHRILHEDGSYRWMLVRGVAVWNGEDSPHRIAGSQTDVTDRKRVERELEHAALHDSLTGLANRALFLDRLDREIQRVTRRRAPTYAVLYLDLDRFKVVNDSLGHLAGDRLLVAFARRLGGCLRPSDTAARLGGDEFAVLLSDVQDPTEVTTVARRIQERMAQPFELDGRQVYATCSTGIARGLESYRSSDAVLRDADIAMYRAKTLGKDRFEEFAPAMHNAAVELLELETDLRQALDLDALSVVYQPTVDTRSERIRTFEALVRWHHPERGVIGPMDFIPMAEETGLVIELDRWVLRTACEQLASWRASYAEADDLVVAVNMSSLQFTRRDLVDHVVEVLEATGVPADRLCLEITESALLTHTPSTSTALRRLRELGVDLAVDDFGTGYSSLGYLHRYPVGTLKVDRSFVSDMEADADKQTIVRTIVRMAESLNLAVVVEGVETADQLDALKGFGCERVQGYLFSRPVDAATAGAFLTGNRPWGRHRHRLEARA